MIDFSDLRPDEIEAGTFVPAGWYRCVIEEVQDNPRLAGVIDVRFLITHGPHKGGHVEDSLWPPENAADLDKAKKCKQRMAMYLTRLSLFTKEQLAGHAVEVDWFALLDRQCFVRAKVAFWEKEGKSGVRTKVEFDGVYSLDDERVPADVRAKNGVAAKKGGDQGEGGATAPRPGSPPPRKPVDYSNL